MKNKYYNINKLKEINKPIKIVTIKPVLTQLKEMLIGKQLVQVRNGFLHYATIIDLGKTKVVAREKMFDDSDYFWFIPYNSKEWLLCD